jgi:hypothetical protein
MKAKGLHCENNMLINALLQAENQMNLKHERNRQSQLVFFFRKEKASPQSSLVNAGHFNHSRPLHSVLIQGGTNTGCF